MAHEQGEFNEVAKFVLKLYGTFLIFPKNAFSRRTDVRARKNHAFVLSETTATVTIASGKNTRVLQVAGKSNAGKRYLREEHGREQRRRRGKVSRAGNRKAILHILSLRNDNCYLRVTYARYTLLRRRR